MLIMGELRKMDYVMGEERESVRGLERRVGRGEGKIRGIRDRIVVRDQE